MAQINVDRAIAALNERLKAAAISPRVRRNGSKLVIRATVPSRSGIGTDRGEFSLGIPANKDGLKLAESKCHDLAKQLMLGVFQWADWKKDRAPKLDEMSVSQLTQNFKAEYLRSRRITESTWLDQWQRTFNRLPLDEPLTETLLLAAILSTDAHTETRKRACQRFQALADYAGIQIDLAPYRGNYGYKDVKPRDIPSDDLIVEWRDRVPNPAWQWCFGMMATFGLRPHECFFCEFIDDRTVKVLEGTKTGTHTARAILPQWAEQWSLIEVNRPIVTGQRPSDYGNRNKRQFQRYEVPFPAYNLRHAYALRGSLVLGLSTTDMAKMMGHSEAVHIRTYRRWLSEAEVQKNYDRLVLKKPPEFP